MIRIKKIILKHNKLNIKMINFIKIKIKIKINLKNNNKI
jgi:hypothetical protein